MGKSLKLNDEKVVEKLKNHPDYKVGDPKKVGKQNAKLCKTIWVEMNKELKEQQSKSL